MKFYGNVRGEVRCEFSDPFCLSIIVNPPVAIMAPNFSRLVSKFWKRVPEQKYALTSRKYALTPRKCTNFPRICTNLFLNNFRISGAPPSPGVYNDTNFCLETLHLHVWFPHIVPNCWCEYFRFGVIKGFLVPDLPAPGVAYNKESVIGKTSHQTCLM